MYQCCNCKQMWAGVSCLRGAHHIASTQRKTRPIPCSLWCCHSAPQALTTCRDQGQQRAAQISAAPRPCRLWPVFICGASQAAQACVAAQHAQRRAHRGLVTACALLATALSSRMRDRLKSATCRGEVGWRVGACMCSTARRVCALGRRHSGKCVSTPEIRTARYWQTQVAWQTPRPNAPWPAVQPTPDTRSLAIAAVHSPHLGLPPLCHEEIWRFDVPVHNGRRAGMKVQHACSASDGLRIKGRVWVLGGGVGWGEGGGWRRGGKKRQQGSGNGYRLGRQSVLDRLAPASAHTRQTSCWRGCCRQPHQGEPLAPV